MSKRFWFEAINGIMAGDVTWTHRVGMGEDTPIALVTGKDDYEATAHARIITAALNDAARAAALAANHDEEGE